MIIFRRKELIILRVVYYIFLSFCIFYVAISFYNYINKFNNLNIGYFFSIYSIYMISLMYAAYIIVRKSEIFQIKSEIYLKTCMMWSVNSIVIPVIFLKYNIENSEMFFLVLLLSAGYIFSIDAFSHLAFKLSKKNR